MTDPARTDDSATPPPQVVTLHKQAAPNPSAATEQEEVLYEVRKKIHVRAVSGLFATWRWALVWFTQLLYYGLPWLPWNGRQGVLFDLVHRKFYILGLVFWPQDVFYLAVLLIISAYSMFLFTAVAGRLWCGYACPQTVYTEIFMWIEQKIEGDRNKRMKLDAEPMGARKFGIRAAKFGAWGAVAIWTGFTFVGYFTPIRQLASEVLSWSLGPWELFWILFYGAFTYLFAGHMREQVCKYMCPYARFQGVMFDPDTLVITYDTERGEPRGSRKKGVDPRSLDKGDCVDCGICVQVCPTGIDIRNGMQYECIGCAACIDACDQVMDKMSYPRGLIRYSTENAIAKHWGMREIMAHLLRPRTVIYSTILIAIVIAAAWALAVRVPLKADFIRDRGVLARELDDGEIENVFRIQLMNTAEVPRTFEISVTGLDGIKIESNHKFSLDAASTQTDTLRVEAPAESGRRGSNHIYFEVRATDDPAVFVREKAAFLKP